MAGPYGLIFDVDGVIADTEAINARASIRVFADLLAIEGVKREDFEAGLGRGAEAYVQAAARVHGITLTPDQVAQVTARRQQCFLEILASELLPAFPGVLELIEAAMECDDIRVGIATSSTRAKSEAVLKSAGVPFGQLVYINGDDVTKKKPDPQLFLICAERLGIDPSRCVVIEDAPNGVEAAKAAGSKCIAVTNSTTADKLGQADLIVDELTDIDVETIVQLIEQPSR